MKLSIKNKFLTVLSVVLALCMLVSVSFMVKFTAKADFTTETIALVKGASVRVDSAEKSGLKFKAQLDKVAYNELFATYGDKVSAGMIIVPTELIPESGNTFTDFNTAGTKVGFNTVKEFKISKDDDSKYEFTMSIVNLYEKNYARDFEAIAFIEIDSGVQIDGYEFIDVTNGTLSADDGVANPKNYIYATRNTEYARNIYTVAKDVYNDRADVQDEVKYTYDLGDGTFATLDTTGIACAKSFIDGVAEIINDNGTPKMYSSDYYTSPYALIADGSEYYVFGNAAGIVYSGEKINTPFVDEDNGISVKEIYSNGASYKDGVFTTAGYNTDRSDYNEWAALDFVSGTLGYVAFDQKYDASTYIEVTFKGANMPNVMFFADDVSNGRIASASVPKDGGKGIIGITGVSKNGKAEGTPPSSPQYAYQVYGPYRMHGHFPSYASAAERWITGIPSLGGFINAGADVEYRAVIGTFIKLEDVHNANGAIYGAEEEKDGVLEKVLYYDIDVYNASTGARINGYEFKLNPSNGVGTSAVDATKYILADDMEAGGIMLFSSLLGKDETTGEVIDSTFRITKNPYHVHSYVNVYSDIDGHWFACDCGALSEKVAHSGGTATYTEKAKCEVCGTAHGELRPNHDADNVIYTNMTGVSAKQVVSTDKGEITFTTTQENPDWRKTSDITLKQIYSKEFIKVGFTATKDVTTAADFHNGVGLGIGFRKQNVAIGDALGEWSITPRTDANYLTVYYSAAHLYTTRGIVDNWIPMVKGETYYWTIGITTDSAGANTLHVIMSDANGVLKGYAKLPQSQFTAHEQNKGYKLENSGYYTIHSWGENTRTITWEILSEAEAMSGLIANATSVSGTRTATSGEVTFTPNGASTIIVKDNGDSFIKVGFKGLADGSSAKFSATTGLSIGVRGIVTTASSTNWNMVPWGNDNGAYICKDGANRSHYGGIGSRYGATPFSAVTKDTQYYFLTGVVGQGDESVFYWCWLDADNKLIKGSKITKAQLDQKYKCDMLENGYFTIHNSADTGERTLTYEVLSSTDALALVGSYFG